MYEVCCSVSFLQQNIYKRLNLWNFVLTWCGINGRWRAAGVPLLISLAPGVQQDPHSFSFCARGWDSECFSCGADSIWQAASRPALTKDPKTPVEARFGKKSFGLLDGRVQLAPRKLYFFSAFIPTT